MNSDMQGFFQGEHQRFDVSMIQADDANAPVGSRRKAVVVTGPAADRPGDEAFGSIKRALPEFHHGTIPGALWPGFGPQ